MFCNMFSILSIQKCIHIYSCIKNIKVTGTLMYVGAKNPLKVQAGVASKTKIGHPKPHLNMSTNNKKPMASKVLCSCGANMNYLMGTQKVSGLFITYLFSNLFHKSNGACPIKQNRMIVIS